MVEKQCKGLWL